MKKTKQVSNSLFWLKHVFLALIIIAIAAAVLVMQKSNESSVLPEGNMGKKSIASNMSNFYADYRLSSRHPREEELGDFVMEVKTSDKPLGERLQKMESLQKPISGRWVGEHKHRMFKAGSTLRSAITDYAQSEGMQVIWELDQDFIVKHPFQLDDSILGSLKIIANAIDANFNGEVKAYMCPRQRSLVITAKSSEYLETQCAEARK
ncbi:toxin co-regulated pilus biosynthesis Q family protein [uncultured Paraglaciecola sp.]|uniref:toxin co-regulated pilus biosynthesis Q family protein n=1 Tax=uncultured Paraglaciecola sp. TaxID=1765024 RepID=UPI0030D81D14|tara:strand:- start:14902 stop:15522 length:621 start_codon:yes stop_codon:yes gene_type:complete